MKLHFYRSKWSNYQQCLTVLPVSIGKQNVSIHSNDYGFLIHLGLLKTRLSQFLLGGSELLLILKNRSEWISHVLVCPSYVSRLDHRIARFYCHSIHFFRMACGTARKPGTYLKRNLAAVSLDSASPLKPRFPVPSSFLCPFTDTLLKMLLSSLCSSCILGHFCSATPQLIAMGQAASYYEYLVWSLSDLFII